MRPTLQQIITYLRPGIVDVDAVCTMTKDGSGRPYITEWSSHYAKPTEQEIAAVDLAAVEAALAREILPHDAARRIEAARPGVRVHHDFDLQDDGEGPYLKRWLHKSPPPTKAEIIAAKPLSVRAK